jgi:hypothetical protein
VGYQHGGESVDRELLLVQTEVERIGPIIKDAVERIDSLEGTRDNIRGMFAVILTLNGTIIAILLWALSHIQTIQLGTK